MITSPEGRKFIEMWEEDGKPSLHAYDDGTGVWTIGFGHTTSAGLPRVYKGMTITADEADKILSSDLASIEADVTHHVKTSLSQAAFDALVSFDFNTGGLDRSSLLRDINNGHTDHITHDFAMWNRGGGRVLDDLVDRRAAEALLYNTGQYTVHEQWTHGRKTS